MYKWKFLNSLLLLLLLPLVLLTLPFDKLYAHTCTMYTNSEYTERKQNRMKTMC